MTERRGFLSGLAAIATTLLGGAVAIFVVGGMIGLLLMGWGEIRRDYRRFKEQEDRACAADAECAAAQRKARAKEEADRAEYLALEAELYRRGFRRGPNGQWIKPPLATP